MQKLVVKKASQEQEPFSAVKLRRSMLDSGASEKVINDIIRKIRNHLVPGTSTAQIHRLASNMLKVADRTYAARYNLKKAIMQLGPDGFPFERYFGQLLVHFGYKVKTNVVVNGQYITHEVDVIAEKHQENIHAIIEAKFHSHPGRKTGSKDALYTYARFLDIQNEWENRKKKGAKPKKGKLQSWLVTNTEMSSNAIDYCNGVGIKVVAWSYPDNSDQSLQGMIHSTGLYPVTTLTSLNNQDKKSLIKQDVILCKNLLDNRQVLRRAKLSQRQIENVLSETDKLCGGEN